MKYSKIFLVGFMGCGKSTYGKKLAKALNWKFVDLDDYIEREEDRSISDIFKEDGEGYFRNLESRAVIESSDWEGTVISTGGGTPCFNNNMGLINSLGLSIYINLPAETLAERLNGEKSKRPLIADLNDEELLSFIKSKLLERNPFYMQSVQVFDYLNKSETDFLEEISPSLELT